MGALNILEPNLPWATKGPSDLLICFHKEVGKWREPRLSQE